MHRDLLDLLTCPRCLPAESPLHLEERQRDGAEIVTGDLHCRHCGRGYPIRDGLATLLPEEDVAPDPYAGGERLSSYLWAHYADLWQDARATPAYREWRSWLGGAEDVLRLDLGCAVGRFTFELAEARGLTLGVDRCAGFVRAARTLHREGELTFTLRDEGRQGHPVTLTLPPAWRQKRCEFLVADALALPFRAGTFGQLASLNLIDKLPRPRTHLEEVTRVAHAHRAAFLFADPFSWSSEVAPEEAWLGGQSEGPYRGAGSLGVTEVLAAKVSPPWRLARQGEVDWTLRNHRNHFEQIRSATLLFTR